MGKIKARVTILVFSQANHSGLKTNKPEELVRDMLILLRIPSRCIYNLSASLSIVKRTGKYSCLPKTLSLSLRNVKSGMGNKERNVNQGLFRNRTRPEVRAKSSDSIAKGKSTERTQ